MNGKENVLEAERPEASWGRQRRQIASRLADRPSLSLSWRRAWAPALAAAALLAVFLTRGGPSLQRPQDSDADQALLSAVQHSIHAEAPTALRPAALLVAEVARGVPQPDHRIAVPKGDQP